MTHIFAIDVLASSDAVGLFWAVVAFASACAQGRVRRQAFRGLLLGEDGVSYLSGVILIFPVKIMLVALFVELTLLLAATAGAFYATYATARSAIVWLSAEPRSLAAERIRLAAVQAMVPFASSDPRHLVLSVPVVGADASAYADAYRRYCPGGPLGDGYLANKYRYASLATTVSGPPAAPRWNSDVTAALRFEHAIRTPILGRVIGHPAPWGANVYTYTIMASVVLRNEGPRNDSQTLGINYVSE
jgi:hypothetical protein